MPSAYLPRFADQELTGKLNRSGAVLVRGAKWCGKTATCTRRTKRVPSALPGLNGYENNLIAAQAQPSLLLDGAAPHLIDEWQVAPQLWDAVRFAVEQSGEKGRFILTGSATPLHADERPKHSGTGRFSFLTMRPMSLFESQESSGRESRRRFWRWRVAAQRPETWNPWSTRYAVGDGRQPLCSEVKQRSKPPTTTSRPLPKRTYRVWTEPAEIPSTPASSCRPTRGARPHKQTWPPFAEPSRLKKASARER